MTASGSCAKASPRAKSWCGSPANKPLAAAAASSALGHPRLAREFHRNPMSAGFFGWRRFRLGIARLRVRIVDGGHRFGRRNVGVHVAQPLCFFRLMVPWSIGVMETPVQAFFGTVVIR